MFLRFLASLIFFNGCFVPTESEEETNPISSDGPLLIDTNSIVSDELDLSCRKGTLVEYNSFGISFMRNYCLSCHSANFQGEDRYLAPVDINFDTAQDILQWRVKIIKTLKKQLHLKYPLNHISKEDSLLMQEWLNCGAPSSNESIETLD